jgi:hypothetical protein
MTADEFEKTTKEIRKELLDESIRKKPSIYCLDRIGNKLFEIVIKLKSENKVVIPTLLSLKIDLEVYLEDLSGELQHDYNKDNKRYKVKWTNESRKIDEFVLRLKEYLMKIETEK